MPHIQDVANPATREEWLQARRSGIGGSDAAAVLGLSPWKSPLALWLEKTGRTPLDAPDPDIQERLKWGTLLEPVIAAEYRKRTGRPLRQPPQYHIDRSPAHPFMLATLDYVIAPDPREGVVLSYLPGVLPEDAPVKTSPGSLSVKNCDKFVEDDWEPDAPLQYQAQLQHELVVIGADWGSFGALMGGNNLKVLDALRNEEFISLMIEKEEEFWDLVQRDICPPADGHPATTEAIRKLHPKDSGEVVLLPDEFALSRQRLKAITEEKKSLEQEEECLKNEIRLVLGPASYGVLPQGGGWSFRNQDNQGYTVAPYTARPLRWVNRVPGR